MAQKDASLALENVVQQLEQEAETLQEVHKLKSLKSRLRNMSMVVREFDGKEYDPEVADWLHKVRNIALETQDVIDSLVIDSKLQKRKSKLGRLFSRGRSIKHHIEEIADIENRIISYFKDVAGVIRDSRHIDHISSEMADVVGFKDYKEDLVSRLIQGGSQRDIILIFGEGGLGKTTLAKMVYNDAKIKHHFAYRAWLSAPQELLLGESLWSIWKHTIPTSTETDLNMNEAELKAKLSQIMKGKKYLVVIDNLFNNEVCNALISLFPDESNGSRILLTSKLAPTTLQVSQSLPYKIEPLDTSQSWDLLSRKVFRGVNYLPELEDLGKRIVDRCKGYPQAIVALATIMNQVEKTKDIWSKFLEDSSQGGNLVGYPHLQKEVQLCFLYFGVFPPGFRMPTKRIIQMWVAEGLAKQRGRTKAEEIGKGYLQELISKHLIQVGGANRGADNVKTCHISNYDSLLCVSEAEEKKFLKVMKTGNAAPLEEIITRLAIHSDSLLDVLKSLGNCSHVDTLHCFGNGTTTTATTTTTTTTTTTPYHPDPIELLGGKDGNCNNNNPILIDSAALWAILHHKFPNIKVLNLGSLVLERIPKVIGKLIHLRYLRLRAPNVTQIPDSISGLAFLETLDMRESCLHIMTHGVWKMKHLRHLYLGGFTMPNAHGIDYYKALWNLQTLSGVHPDKVLKQLMVKAKFPNVTRLRICNSDRQATLKFLNSIDHLCHLRSLRVENPTRLPDPNAFPLSLTKLTFLRTRLHPSCVGTLGKLPNLRMLKLLRESISGKEMECNDGGFSQLEVLCLDLVLENLTLGKGAMRCLKHFFANLKVAKLEAFPENLQRIATDWSWKASTN